jgi:hypothetical protein
MTPQEMQAKLEQAEEMFKQTFIKLYLHEWWGQVLEKREVITPSDWLNIAIIQMEMLLDAQSLEPDQREKLAFEVTQELHRRLSGVEMHGQAS